MRKAVPQGTNVKIGGVEIHSKREGWSPTLFSFHDSIHQFALQLHLESRRIDQRVPVGTKGKVTNSNCRNCYKLIPAKICRNPHCTAYSHLGRLFCTPDKIPVCAEVPSPGMEPVQQHILPNSDLVRRPFHLRAFVDDQPSWPPYDWCCWLRIMPL